MRKSLKTWLEKMIRPPRKINGRRLKDAQDEPGDETPVPSEPQPPQAEPPKPDADEPQAADAQPQEKPRKKITQKIKTLRKAKEKPKVKKNWWLRLLFVCAVFGALYCVYGSLTDISHFEVTFYTVEEEEIKSPVRIAFLSDLHLNQLGPDNIDLVREIDRLHPDIIAIGGDMTLMHNPDYSVVSSLCSQLKEIAPVYYGIGNHEYNDILFEGSNILTDLDKLGVTMLSNRFVTINVNGNLIDIGGLNETMDQFAQYGVKFWNRYNENAHNYRLLLVHDPGYFRASGGQLKGADIDLALCGHYHGGQIVLPVIGALYHPEGGFRPELASGCNLVENTHVVVSRGLGNHSKLPRFNNPPELVIIDLR